MGKKRFTPEYKKEIIKFIKEYSSKSGEFTKNHIKPVGYAE